MSGLDVIAIAIAVVAAVGFVVALYAICAHAAYLIHQERRTKGIELEVTPDRSRLGTKTRPRRSHDRPHDH